MMNRHLRSPTRAAALAPFLACCLLSLAAPQTHGVPGDSAGHIERLLAQPILWPSRPPADCPFEKSNDIVGVLFTGRHKEYTGADTWYPSWASDGNLYSPWTDGSVNGVGCSSGGPNAQTGHAKIIGDDPMDLQVVHLGLHAASPAPYGGRYPCGSLVHNGIWYYGTYCLMNEGGSLSGDVTIDGQRYNWGVLGPFVGFRISRDYGKSWIDTPRTPSKPLFGEPETLGGKVKIGAPHFVDFGKNMEHSPDGKAYLVGHGAVDPDPKPRRANLSWISGDQVYLVRVTPSPENINDMSRYEFFGGHDATGAPIWTNDFARIKPLVDWNNCTGVVTMTYNAPLKKYIMCITDGWPTVMTMNTYLLESDNITGPWRLISFMEKFGEQGYFVNIPSKFISRDGRAAWLCYAANFTNGYLNTRWKSHPPGSRYGMCLQEVNLLTSTTYQKYAELDFGDPVKNESNAALGARATASSVYPEYRVGGAIDGVLGGFPGDIANEWASKGENVGAWIRLDWDAPQLIDRIALWDRPNTLDRITSSILTFSDGSTIQVGDLPDDGYTGKEVIFSPRTVTSVKFTVSGAKKGSPNIGLSEIAVFRKNR